MPRFVVHRGGAALCPDNSLLAFRNAIALGARLLEFDVHRTADAEAAVIHDPTLDRTTNGSGPVAARTAAELRGVRLKGPDGALTDEWVPTIDERLALAGPAGLAVLVQVKTPGPAPRHERQGDPGRGLPGPPYQELEEKIVRP